MPTIPKIQKDIADQTPETDEFWANSAGGSDGHWHARDFCRQMERDRNSESRWAHQYKNERDGFKRAYEAAVRQMNKAISKADAIKDLESECAASLNKSRENATLAGDLLSENRRLKLALIRATQWGMRSDGFSGEVSDALRIWVDGGMVGDPPAIPSYYPGNTRTSSDPPAPQTPATDH